MMLQLQVSVLLQLQLSILLQLQLSHDAAIVVVT